MSDLRDALAAMLLDQFSYPADDMDDDDWDDEADAILADPAFRQALTESIAEAIGAGALYRWEQQKDSADRAAVALVARMLGETT